MCSVRNCIQLVYYYVCFLDDFDVKGSRILCCDDEW